MCLSHLQNPCHFFINFIFYNNYVSIHVYISHLYPYHLLTNGICDHMCLYRICTLLTFVSAGSVIIIIYISLDFCHLLNYHLDLSSYVFPTSLLLSPPYQSDLSSEYYMSIPTLYPCHLLINLTCYHTSLSHPSTLVTSVST